MLAPLTAYEEYHGATADYDEILLCDKCGGEISADEPYITKWNNDVMCADCIEKAPAEKILEFIGYDNIFDMLDKLKVLEYA